MRRAIRLLAMIAVLPLTACPDEKPVDLSAAKSSARHEMPAAAAEQPPPRPTMPSGKVPIRIPTASSSVTLAFAPELVIFDHKIVRIPTASWATFVGEAVDYVVPMTSLAPSVTARLDDSAGDIALFVNTEGSATETLYLLDDLKLERVAFAVDTNGDRGQLGYLFGIADPTVRDKLALDLAYGEIVMADATVPVNELVKIAKEQRARSTIGITARIGVRRGTTNQHLAAVLSGLAKAKIDSVQIYASQDPDDTGGGMRSSTGAVPTVQIGQPNAQGDLDKAIIRRYIKRNIQKITYCYEKALLTAPDLKGTVVVQFFIRPDGKVAVSTGSGVAPDVSSCVANVIRAIEFPKPKGGGGVQVNYPFTFRMAGF